MSKLENALNPPFQCDACCSENIEFTTNKRIYGKNYGKWPAMYYCNDCRAAVGCHNGTDKPLGLMADRATRQLRSKAHDEFDPLWKSGLMTRSRAYNWLALQLGIDAEECHISWLSKDQLKDVATLSSDYLRKNYDALVRRKEKSDARQEKSERRTENASRRDGDEARRQKTKRRTNGTRSSYGGR